jgi:hypothetical protein
MTERVNDRAPIHQTVDLPDGAGQLVVFDWSADKRPRSENLVCLNAAGGVVWTAELPAHTNPDCFVGVQLDGNTIRARTFSGYLVTLDHHAGKILTIKFTK